MNIAQVAKKRYTTKVYDPSKKITPEAFAQIKKLLKLSPSSLNLQPWHFIIAEDDAGKARIAKGCEGNYQVNAQKVMDASHVVVYCSKLDMEDAHVQKVTDSEERDGRFADSDAKATRYAHMQRFINQHREADDVTAWNARQAYINMGSVLLGAAALGIDATPMEGVDYDALNTEFALQEKGYQALAVLAFGYHSDDDFNAKLPKSRLAEDEIFTIL